MPQGMRNMHDIELCSGYGRYHTDSPIAPNAKPFNRITYNGIIDMARTPSSTSKPQAQWFIPSTLLSRAKAEQMAKGVFYLLTLDIDHNAPKFSELRRVLSLVVGGSSFLIYTSKSATDTNPKSHIVIPVVAPLTGYRWKLCQMIVNDKFQAEGVEPDRKTEDANQIIYLPNKGKFYDHSVGSGELFNPLTIWRPELFAKHEQVQESKKQRLAVQKKPTSKTELSGDSLIDEFNNQYQVAEILTQAGYAQKGQSFKHPNSNTGNYSASIKETKVHTLSSADPLFLDGGAHSAYGAFVILFHSGDSRAAIIDAGDNWLEVDGVSWNKAAQRKYMESKK